MANKNEETSGIDPYVMLLIKTTSRETAQAVLNEHETRCNIGRLSTEIWGNDHQPGIKTRVHDVEKKVDSLAQCKAGVVALLRDKLAVPILVAVVTAILIGGLARQKASAEATTQPAAQAEK